MSPKLVIVSMAVISNFHAVAIRRIVAKKYYEAMSPNIQAPSGEC